MEMKVAEAAVSFAVGKLGEALIHKVAFLRGVEDQVEELKRELEFMSDFLQHATQKQNTDDGGIHRWISDIRKVAHDAEDVIETFTLRIDNPRRSRGKLKNCACFPLQLKQLNNLGKDIERIRVRLQNLSDRRIRYGIPDLGSQGTQSQSPNIALRGRRLVPQGRDKDVVGLDDKIRKLVREGILTDRSGLLVAGITGMGGLGKSTLAREVYNHDDMVARFDCRAWVFVSEDFNAKQVIKQLVLNLVGRRRNMDEMPPRHLVGDLSNMDEMPEEELKNILYEHLQDKEYFIVLDDVWRQEHWESLADAFPADQQDKRSRLLVTSRTQNVPSIALYRHELKPLDEDMSWQLFLKKSNCPHELESIGREIAGRCCGLPLAITAIGGLLRVTRPSENAWNGVLKDLKSDLGRSNNDRISAVLELSYNDLPPVLKSCFLCLAFFKEDAIIRANKLIQVWIAEGLITERGGKTMEEISMGYLDDLINRNLVQVKHISDQDKVVSCQMHDLLRELSIKKAETEIGFKILKEGTNSQASDESRHRVIYCSTGRYGLVKNPNDKHVRSLFFRETVNIQEPMDLHFNHFMLLRVLDFEGFDLSTSTLSETIGDLIGLKYLGLRYTKLNRLPRTIRRLKNLQVLDLLENDGMYVEDDIWELENLRHLYMSGFNMVRVGLRLNTLKNLQTLIFFPSDNGTRWSPKHLKEMINLRKLSVRVDASITNMREFITSLGKLKNLEFLYLSLVREDITLEGLDTLQSLTELSLLGKLGALPSSVDNFPPNLSHLTLFCTKLEEDPMSVLEKLPNLLYLNLDYKAYVGREMVISDDGFPRLRVLYIDSLNELRKIELVGEGLGMPQLKRFKIMCCSEIESLPERMTSLQELEILCCPKIESLMERMKSTTRS